MGRYKYTDQELIKKLKETARKLGRTPKRREVRNPGSWVYSKRFGSWNKALKTAGLTPLKEIGLSKEHLKKVILDFYKKYGRTPSISDFYKNPYLPDPRHIQRKFGMRWNDIMRYLGLPVNQEHHPAVNLSDEELLTLVKETVEEFRKKNNRLPYIKEFRKFDNLPSLQHLINRFKTGTYNGLLMELGYEKEELTGVTYKDDELLNIIKKRAEELGRPPVISDMDPTIAREIRKRFGWNNALKKAGLSPLNKTPVEVTESDEELLEMYINFCRKLNKPASAIDLNKSDEIYNSDVFKIRFGSMNNLRRLAGMPECRSGKNKYTKEQIKDMLIAEYRRLGRIPTNREIKENKKLPSPSTILRHFRTTSMREVWLDVLKK